MSTRFSFNPLVMFATLSVILACSMVSPRSAQAPSSPVSAVTSVQSGIPFSATPIRLVIPDVLATGANADTIDVVTEQTGAPGDIAPAHLQVTFQGYALPASFHVPQLFVYPAEPYAALNQSAAESIKSLQAVLANPAVQYEIAALPRVPFFTAGQVFAAQQKVIRFSGGSGLRIVTQYAQDKSPINNSGLFYHFEGLSDDTKYYVIAILPVNLPFLPADNNPSSPVPAGGVPFPAGVAPGSSFEDYFKRTTDLIGSAPADQFNPSLSTLDTLIESISTP